MNELLRLLHIEDSASDAALILRLLTKAGYRVESTRVEDAEGMRAALAEREWDAIIADYHLPRFDAPAALQVLKDSGLDIPFIVVSGLMGEDTAVQMMTSGAHDYVLKNNMARLAPAVEREVREARTRRERRHAEESLRASEQREKLRAAELEAIMDAMPVAMFVARDREARHVSGNRAAYELLRMPPGANLSKFPPENETPAPYRITRNGRDVPVDELPVRKASMTGERVLDYEMEFVLEDGTSRTMIGNAVPFLEAGGRPRGAVALFLDITERKQAEERLRHSQKLESIGLLAGGVAHDFNNLLTVIMGSASAGLLECPECQYVKDIIGASERAAHLTKQLLAYAGEGQFVIQTLELSELILRAQTLLSASVPKRVSVDLNLSNQELLVEGDPSQIEQILMNLVINAGEAIPPQTDGRIEIRTSACEITPEMVRQLRQGFDARPGPFVCLEVTDNGAGMDEATLSRIFDPFFSTKFAGRGLGLAAVHGIVRARGGFIAVRSSRDSGTTFQVFLPVAGERRQPEIPIHPRPPAPRRPRGASPTILIVDDEGLVRKLAAMALKSRGYEVLQAGNGREALEMLEGSGTLPSLVLLDLAMPVMGGDELVPILQEKYPALKIICSSGYTEEEALRGFPERAVAGFLQKPYTVVQLVEKLEEVLAQGRGGE